jgi:hypothetical protein
LQDSLLEVDISQIVVHEADEPNAVVHFFDSEPLTGEHGREVDLLAVPADTAAGGDQDVPVVEEVVQLRQAGVGP